MNKSNKQKKKNQKTNTNKPMTIKQNDLKFVFKQRHRVHLCIGKNTLDQPTASIQNKLRSITFKKMFAGDARPV
jgi:hypothetical protein